MKFKFLLSTAALFIGAVSLNAQVTYNYTGTGSFNVPGVIQAEDFKQGGEGVGYHDVSNSTTDAWMPMRTGTQVNVSGWNPEAIALNGDADGTPVVGWVGDGEWLMYTIVSASAKTYEFWICSAGPNTQPEGKLNVYLNNVKKLTDATFKAQGTESGNWNYEKWIKLGTIDVAAGSQSMRVEFAKGGGNVNAFRIIEPTSARTIDAENNIQLIKNNDLLGVNSSQSIKKVSIYSLNGKLMTTQFGSTNRVTVPLIGLIRGVYMVTVETTKGITTKKFVF